VMSEQEGAKAFGGTHYGGKEGQILCRSVLNLPLFPYMSQVELDRIVDVVSSAI